MENAPPPPNPLQFFINDLESPDPNARIRAADALTLAAEEGINASGAISALAKLLGDTAPVADHAARALFACFLKGGDLSAVLPTLQTELDSPQLEVRLVGPHRLSLQDLAGGRRTPEVTFLL